MRKINLNHAYCKSKAFYFIVAFVFLSQIVAGQQVKGVVTDSDGITLPGVSVQEKGTINGVSTNSDGVYSITVKSNATLVFSYLGYKTKEVVLKESNTINVTMEESFETLDEIVVIGYGTQKRSDINSSISSVKAADLANIKQVSIDQMLQGKAAGVSVTANSGSPGGAASIRIRGTTSLTGTNEPLYIIDGVPISGDATGRSTSGQPLVGRDGFSSEGGGGNNAVSPLSMINPNDIESVDILKDASATAIYGSRGANGVIIITTKSGKKGNGKVAYESYISIMSNYKNLDVMNLQEFAKNKTDLAVLYGNEVRPEFSHPELLGKGTDWQDEVYRVAIAKNHQISFSGAKEGVNYYLSGGFLDQQGTIIGSGLKRYTVRLNVDANIKSWLKVGANLTSGITNEKVTVNQSFSGLISNTLLQAPDIPVRNADGSFAGPPDPSQSVTYYNPVAEALTRENKLIRKNFLGNVYAEATILDGLKYRVEFSANTEFSQNEDFRPSYKWGSQVNLTADLDTRNQNWYSTNFKNLLTYDKRLGNHSFTILLGQEANDSHWEGLVTSSNDFQTNENHTINLANPDNNTVTGYKGSAAISSYFSRLIYNFDNKYSFTASIRSDTSSKFDPSSDNQTGTFKALSGSWKLSNESFMESTKDYIDNIKFRVGYGETGNQQIENNRYTALLGAQNSNLGTGFLVSNSPNPFLTWESLNQINVGVDFTLFDSNLSASFDFYDKTSEGFLFQVPLPVYLTGGGGQYGGISAPYSNLGEMQNKGYEFTIGYNLNKDKFNWNTSLNFSHYTNKLVKIQDGIVLTQQVNTNGYQPVVVTNTLIGNPIGMFYGYVSEGIFNDLSVLNSAPLQFGQPVGTAVGETYLGDIKYKDINEDGVVDALDRTLLGSPHPDFTFGFTNNFNYKNFDLSIFLQGSYGNEIMNLTRRAGTKNTSLYENQLVEAINYWTPTNTDTDIPRPIQSDSNTNLLISNRYIEDGSYVRIQNLTFGYSLPQNVLDKLKMSRLRVYGSAQNLYTFTNYSGYDPEIGSFNQSPLLSGIDNGRYPSPRTFSFGINLEF
ncbi:SusC/RagA family protein [Polaribacter vadi]|uniref:SusC/RagA family TonB-linked outer membrane protein n=1 Tax=Polaribacter vadi TaxID=1774273 RepID=A0A1B8TUC5_9FLAO|nr:TonB-dependent receptor [Polaribacter vadi]AOW19073.1 SusC/RagA family protein [Polaribacter vadi]OBY63129.1 SusC/RagA family TonB-linked outer membrane protein [Polaribacter vadi]|tara:strand:- start:4162 stop:7341 length:3180 start_codon:yes stop_codon:yes gene_type:complete